MNLRSLIPVGRDRASLARRADNPFWSLQREIDRLFDDFSRGFPAFGMTEWMPKTDLTPKMDMIETDKEFELTFELPGLAEKDVEINVADNVLTIRGEKKAEKDAKEKDYRMVERSYGAFARTIELPPGVTADGIKATLANGVLTVTIPKPAPASVQKVDIKAAA